MRFGNIIRCLKERTISTSNKKTLLQRFGPGILVAATGVGAGDLAGGAIAGSRLGTTVLWAVLLGAILKFVLTEGLARWQLASGETLLTGTMSRFGLIAKLIFLGYLLLWSYFVGSALLNANGVVATAIAPMPGLSESGSKIVYGILHSLVALLLVLRGGFKLFEKLMTCVIGIMFLIVMATALMVHGNWIDILSGLFIPRIPFDNPDGVNWTIGLLGGVGGTVTVLCYGYWIRESGEQTFDDLKSMRLDLGVGYLMTALFGIAMVIIGSQVDSSHKGAALLVQLAEQLQEHPSLGSWAVASKWLFLVGAWGAVFSSLLGVWQAVPYLFADFWNISFAQKKLDKIGPLVKSYRTYLFLLAIVPMTGLFVSFEKAQKLYAMLGAFFIPILAVVLLLLLGSRKYLPTNGKNRLGTNLVLTLTIVLFLFLAWKKFAG